ncbi:MAG: alanine--tRNA ligase, partial [Anaerolineales bacterium]|nr:alanine--tRNA ligase [Anaerolineales bacterium]
RDDEYLEIWNLVFMQYEKDAEGNMTPLPRPSIDTGMGLERIAFALQGGESNYDTDLFQPAMARVQTLLGDSDEERAENYVGYRVIADHVRAATFLIADGVRPGADGADYVLRMVIRRAARFGRDIGFAEPFMAEVAQVYIDQMSGAYPELRQQAENIKYTLTQEEERFASTLDKALIYFERLVNRMNQAHETEIPGEEAFDLYATHGLPLEITQDLAEQQGFTVDVVGYKAAREEHAQRSGSGAFKQYALEGNVYSVLFNDLVADGKLGVEGVQQEQYGSPRIESHVIGLLRDGERQDEVKTGQKVEVVTAVTPFYVESGGQVSDVGTISVPATGAQIRVEEVRRPLPNLIVHIGDVVQGEVKLNSKAILRVDNERRANIRRNHTATHILHEELRRHLGKHVAQAGSLVAPDRLRFDFTHDQRVSDEELSAIEEAINQTIVANLPVTIAFMEQKEAIQNGAMALFGEKYGDIVRTVKIGQNQSQPYSFELCGGLHVAETNDIQLFQFTNESAVSAGVRRIEAVTGQQARQFLAERLDMLTRVSKLLGVPVHEVEGRLETVLSENKALQKEIDQLKKASLLSEVDDLLAQVQEVAGVNLLTAVVEGADADGLRTMLDKFRDKVQSGVGVLGTANDGRPIVIAMVTDDLVKRGVHAGNLVRDVAKMIGGGGGGRPNLAQAGGKDANRLPEAIAAVPGLVEKMVNS